MCNKSERNCESAVCPLIKSKGVCALAGSLHFFDDWGSGTRAKGHHKALHSLGNSSVCESGKCHSNENRWLW